MQWKNLLWVAALVIPPFSLLQAAADTQEPAKAITAIQSASALLSESRAIKQALGNNPSLAQMQARYKAMAAMPSQRGSLPDPIVSLGAMNFPTDSYDRDQEAMTQLQVGFSQAFPFPGKLGLREEAAEFEAQAAFYAVEEMRLVLARNVSNKWWQVFYLDRALDTNQALRRTEATNL